MLNSVASEMWNPVYSNQPDQVLQNLAGAGHVPPLDLGRALTAAVRGRSSGLDENWNTKTLLSL